MFTANVGTPDRIIRIILGLGLVALPFLLAGLPGWVGIVAPVAGVVLIATSFLAFCPIYRVIGLSTAHRKDL